MCVPYLIREFRLVRVPGTGGGWDPRSFGGQGENHTLHCSILPTKEFDGGVFCPRPSLISRSVSAQSSPVGVFWAAFCRALREKKLYRRPVMCIRESKPGRQVVNGEVCGFLNPLVRPAPRLNTRFASREYFVTGENPVPEPSLWGSELK